jgi:hypothetical protein
MLMPGAGPSLRAPLSDRVVTRTLAGGWAGTTATAASFNFPAGTVGTDLSAMMALRPLSPMTSSSYQHHNSTAPLFGQTHANNSTAPLLASSQLHNTLSLAGTAQQQQQQHRVPK